MNLPRDLFPSAFLLFIVYAIGVPLALAASDAEPPEPNVQVLARNDAGLALGGYSVVSYFQHGKAEKGDESFQAQHLGLTYYFTDAEQLSMFKLAPDEYLPAHGGWCSLMMSGSGNLTPANPESFKLVDGRLLLFWSGEYNGQPISGLGNWESKTKSKPKRELKRLAAADAAWQKVVQGKASPKLLMFSPEDAKRLTETQRTKARKQYE